MRRWVESRIGTLNLGPAGLQALIDAMGLVAILCLQEAGDKTSTISEACKRTGWKPITGTEPGQASTPLVWDPTVEKLLKVSRLLLAVSQDVGPGTGPDRMKQKWLIGGLFQNLESGRIRWVFSVHFVVGQGKKRRRLVAVLMAHRIVLLTRRLRHAVFIFGDTNTGPLSVVLKVLRTAGWKLSQVVGETLPTHGKNWSPDEGMWTPRSWIRYVTQITEDLGSDHMLLIVVYKLRLRPHPAR